MIKADYTYNAKVISVYDGDTVTLLIDLGCWTFIREKCRLHGINTPEVRGKERPEGLVSRDALRELVLGKDVVVRTEKDKTGKYGRLLATLYMGDLNVNDWLVSESLAIYKNY